jgi:hypothetical protein
MWTSNAPGECMSYVTLSWAALLPDAITIGLVLLLPLCYVTRIKWNVWKVVCMFFMSGFGLLYVDLGRPHHWKLLIKR